MKNNICKNGIRRSDPKTRWTYDENNPGHDIGEKVSWDTAKLFADVEGVIASVLQAGLSSTLVVVYVDLVIVFI